jgi:hypothetical protein
MSTPIPPPEPDSAPTAEQAPVEDQAVAPPESQAPVPGPQGPPAGPHGPALGPHPGVSGGPMAGYPYPQPQPYPFAPRVREPWINPAKRGALVLVAIGLAIVLLAGGFVVGATVAHRHDRGHSIHLRQLPGRVGGYGMPGRGPFGFVPRRGTHMVPRLRPPGPGVPTATPVPAPTSSHR